MSQPAFVTHYMVRRPKVTDSLSKALRAFGSNKEHATPRHGETRNTRLDRASAVERTQPQFRAGDAPARRCL